MNVIEIMNLFDNVHNTDIKTELNILSKRWITNKHLWFKSDKKTKNEIKKLFSNIKINFNDVVTSNKSLSLDKIIYYDQIIKYLHQDDLEIIERSKELALEQSLFGIKNKLDINFCPEGRCFYLLPLRHTNNLEYIFFSIKRIYQYIEESCDIPEIYIHFLKSSITQYGKLCNNYPKVDIVNWIKLTPILINKFGLTEFKENDFVKKIKKNLIDLPCKIIVSCDGKVNSMVLLYILSNLYPKKIEATNIDYNNNKNSYLYTYLIAKYCDILNIPFKSRKIKEIKKTNYLNNFYKNYTNKVLYKLYKSFNDDNDWDIIDNYGIFLGDNIDNSFENIIRNISEMKNYDNLKNSKIKSRENDILIYRPLLNICKREIINYANEFKIPYAKDFILKKNKIKNSLVPFLNKFDHNLIPGLINLSNHLKIESEKLEKYYYKPFLDKIIFKKKSAEIDLPPKDFKLWKKIFKNISDYFEIKEPKYEKIINLFNKYEGRNIINDNITIDIKNNAVKIFISKN
jgi:tRNA(Ile)-lysidine synthase TilS/MesJ/uncharacterized protein (DUF924 family)